MTQERQFSQVEIAHMRLAGVPADRPGLLGTYPRMLYKKGDPNANEGVHNLATDANGGTEVLPIDGHKDIITSIVSSEDEELASLEEGWAVSIDAALKVGAKPAKQAA
jgi:hypothetical protein